MKRASLFICGLLLTVIGTPPSTFAKEKAENHCCISKMKNRVFRKPIAVDGGCFQFTDQLQCSVNESVKCQWTCINTIETPYAFCDIAYEYGAFGEPWASKAERETAELRQKCAEIKTAAECNQPSSKCKWTSDFTAARTAIDALRYVQGQGVFINGPVNVSDSKYKEYWYLWEKQNKLTTKNLSDADREAIKARVSK